MTKYWILKEADLPLEVVILLIAGLIFLITGVLLFPVSQGMLPYYENGLYGLFLVLFALQMITLGKTPFGDMQRSKPLLTTGVVIAAVGVTTCFIPGFLGQIPRILLFICFALGGFLQLLQSILSKEKFRTWIKYGGIFYHLIIGCGAVYLLSMMIGLLVLQHNLLTTSMTAVVVLAYGMAIVYLAWILRNIYLVYPEAEKAGEGDVCLSTDQAMILLMSIFMVLLGILLIPVNLGLLPFSASAQLGLLMVIFAIQMLALGSSPIGPFPRTWLMILLGIIFASFGIISCIIPEILVLPLTILVGVLNVSGGSISLRKSYIPLLKRSEKSGSPVSPILRRLFAAQLTMNLLTILFGVSMLVSNLIPGLIIGGILASNGVVLLYLLHILVLLDKKKIDAEPATA